VLAAVGPVFYIALTVVLGALWVGYDPIRDTQSELGAITSPAGIVMNVAGFMLLGIAILAFASVYALVLRGGWLKWVVVGLVVFAGAGMFIVGFFPCDADCIDVTTTGQLHSVFSAPGAIGLPLAAMLSAFVFRTDGRFGIATQLISFWLGLLSLLSGPIVALSGTETLLGLLQRLGMWSALLWMSAITLRLTAIARVESRADGQRPDC